MHRPLLSHLVGVVIIVGSTGAQAAGEPYIKDVLTASRQEELCVAAGAKKRVDPTALASAMVDEARIPMYLRMRSNPEGVPRPVTTEDAIFTVTAENPFPGQTSELAVEATGRLLGLRLTLGDVLKGRKLDEDAYVVSPVNEDARVRDFFSGRTIIYCKSIEEPAEEPKTDKNFVSAQKIKVRKSIENLSEPYDTLEPTAAAHVSFKNDIRAGEQSVEIEITVGKDFETDSIGTLTPFVSYQSKTAEDIETVAAGMLWTGDIGSWEIAAGPRYVWDLEKDSETLKGSVFLYPNVTIAEFSTGIYNKRGPVWIRPDAYLVAEAGTTTASETDPIFIDGDDYYGIGAAVSLDVYIDALQVNLGASYRYIGLFSLPIDEASHFSAAVDYILDEGKHFLIGVGYEVGRNEETFEKVENYNLRFGVKY